uniref:peptidylprolyl isomerase n=1 Tax=Attheya septentrionalis TaxID=420275 RepID=A0A7S2UKX2_9STRA|mmetsp:Transcript_27333/g.49654  ORF Transcript_27333/g.49654 Transcript_27333/m.49654 type:complete len:291 (+) Transcript_27333:191-1063(+)
MLKGISGATKLANAKQLVDLLLEEKLPLLGAAVRKQDIVTTLKLQEECSSLVYDIRSLSMTEGVLPYQIPEEFASLPQLRGRAVVECTLQKQNKGMYTVGVDADNEEKMSQVTLTLTVDGYHAPITAGNFIDLVQRKYYDNMSIQSAEELIVQTGKPTTGDGTTDGFVDPKTKEKRVIPLEIFYKKDKQPTYSYTSDDDMRATESMSLPFQAYGALGMAHDPEDVNTASSQFWFLKWDQALVAPSRNTLDGSQACFGYVTKNQDVLKQVSKGDTIISMKVVQGAENFFAK